MPGEIQRGDLFYSVEISEGELVEFADNMAKEIVKKSGIKREFRNLESLVLDVGFVGEHVKEMLDTEDLRQRCEKYFSKNVSDNTVSSVAKLSVGKLRDRFVAMQAQYDGEAKVKIFLDKCVALVDSFFNRDGGITFIDHEYIVDAANEKSVLKARGYSQPNTWGVDIQDLLDYEPFLREFSSSEQIDVGRVGELFVAASNDPDSTRGIASNILALPTMLFVKWNRVKESKYNDLGDFLREYAFEYFEMKQLLPILLEAKSILRKVLGDNFIDYDLKFITDLNPDRNFTYHREIADQDTLIVSLREDYKSREPELRNREHDLVKMMHEYAHGIFERETDPDFIQDLAGLSISERDPLLEQITIHRVLSEGFATFIELLAAKQLATRFQDFGFTSEQGGHFNNSIKNRTRYFHKSYQNSRASNKVDQKGSSGLGMAYMEGTVKFMHTLFKNGGLPAIINFLRAVDPVKLKIVTTLDPVYQEAVRTGETSKLLTVIGKKSV